MRYIIFTVFMFFSALSLAQPQDFTAYGPRLSSDYRLDLSAFLPADRLSLQEIKTQVSRLQSYEDFLDYLTERRPSLFENSVLVHDSGSLQYADLQRPRVILFGDGLMLAFAEDPHREDRTVEIIAFDARSSSFQFAELKFGAGGGHYQDQPRNCQSCHGAIPKPLWDPYDFWPNAYGSAIGRFGTVAEKNAYEQLRVQSPKAGIYSRLKWTVPPSNRGLSGIETFTQYVNQLQIFSALPRWQKQSPAFNQVVPALLAVLNRCAVHPNDATAAQKLATFFPETWKTQIETNFATWHQKVQDDRRQFKSYQTARYQQLFPNTSNLFVVNHERLAAETQTLAQLFFILELAGIETRDFTLSQGPNTFLMSVPSNQDADLASNMALVAPGIFQKMSPELIKASGHDYSWARFNCADLQAESLLHIQTLSPAASTNSTTGLAPTVFGECMRCHSVNSIKPGIPAIPFDRTGHLRNYLRHNQNAGLRKIMERVQKSGPGQMPPYRKLSPEEMEQLRFNLEQIAGSTGS